MTRVRTVSTTADSAGRTVLLRDEEISLAKWPGADAGDAVIWSTPRVPVDNSDEDLKGDKRKVGMTLHQGSIFRLTELGPGFRTPMHRTLSTDYCVVVAGELDILLDGGEVVRLIPGDTLVQRGTNHAWSNPSEARRCKFLVAMIEASPVRIGERTLSPTPMWRMILSSLRNMLLPAKAAPGIRMANSGVRPAIRRVLTGHDRDGVAVIRSIEDVSLPRPMVADHSEATLWRTAMVPPDNFAGSASETLPPNREFNAGSLFEVIELGPNARLPTGHVGALGYSFVLSGEVQVEFEEQLLPLKAEDAFVQRGTTQFWRNPSDIEICRIFRCVIAAER